MLSEGRREGLKLALNRSFSEPGVSRGLAAPCSLSLPLTPQNPSPGVPLHPVVSMPASPCGESFTIQRSILLRRARALESSEVARRITRNHKTRQFLILDLRPFISYNLRHVKGAINLNCCDRFNRKRLQMKRATVVDLAGSHNGRDLLKRRCFKEVIVYDDASSDIESLPPHHPVFLVLSALMEDNREPLLLKGGFQSFEKQYPELCEDALMRTKAEAYSQYHSLPSPSEDHMISDAAVTQILPFLYLGNAKDAQDSLMLQSEGITQVLNVTSRPPDYQDPGVSCKTLPAADSGHQNLLQYFEEAIRFIDDARQTGSNVLVHCQAGVSRSPTIVIAYLMKHTRMTMVDSYKLVKAHRSIISPNLNFMGQLVQWEAALQANKAEPDCKPCHQCQWQRQEAKQVPSACQV